MKITEIILAILALITFGLSLMLIEGGHLLMVFSLLILSFMYLFFSFALLNGISFRGIFRRVSYNGIGALRIVFAVLTGYALAVAVMGVLFGLSDWEGVGLMLVIGLGTLIFIAILVLIEYGVTKSGLMKRAMPRMLIWAALCVVLLRISPTKIMEFKYREYPEYVQALKN